MDAPVQEPVTSTRLERWAPAPVFSALFPLERRWQRRQHCLVSQVTSSILLYMFDHLPLPGRWKHVLLLAPLAQLVPLVIQAFVRSLPQSRQQNQLRPLFCSVFRLGEWEKNGEGKIVGHASLIPSPRLFNFHHHPWPAPVFGAKFDCKLQNKTVVL